MDRTNISNAISDNMPQDLGFGISGVNMGTLVHSIMFTVFALPTNAIVRRVGAHLWIPILMTSWAITTWAVIFLKDFAGYMVIRVFIALTEAGFIPAVLTYMTGWYKTNELATRLAWLWGIQNFASAVSGLISFGIFRMSGIGGLQGWKWLFLIDGAFTHVIGFIAFAYLPRTPSHTNILLFGRRAWLSERERQIATTRIIRDDLSKKEQYERITWADVKMTVLDTKLWAHLLMTTSGLMPIVPVTTYLPTLIRNFGFPVTTSNLLTAPSYIINLIVSCIIARSADKHGNYVFHIIFGCVWSIAGFLALQLLPDNAGRWSFYAAALVTAGSPSWHGLQIAWMSSNMAPVAKRTLALGIIVAAANVSGVPGSQIYQDHDAPRFHTGNWINIGLIATAIILMLFQRTRYDLTNRWRSRKWDQMTEFERQDYLATTKDKGNDRLDFRFRL
ncbi:major facilitator superfamily domain-containing protein [Radiomyces spectabilis]|uniref:major facilitator superfamily domain-containing protein n=1 Tax=Radiomyces spectabilis TaxID=64574 RepID=UPI0022201D9B|nr:major facilitator superfamily domain-containing protein [Radiomyces spectabilis]KAI8379619.1 major facilitator superfamily domain-containing protein [Radiomyces spectabilis]